MTKVIIYGSPNSTYVRSTRLACEEKGVAHELRAVGSNTIADLKTPEHKALHPFGRIPVMQHGDFTLFETSAICRYVDEAFDGPPLQPADLQERALMSQWVSAIKDYMVKDMVFDFVVQYAVPRGPDGQPDLDRIEAAKPRIRDHCEILDRALVGRTYLAGDGPSVADFLLTPIMHYVGNTPGGMPLFEGLDNLGRWWGAVSARASFKATVPPSLEHATEAA